MDSRGQEGAELNYYDWESDCGDCEGSLIVTRGGALLNILCVEGAPSGFLKFLDCHIR